MGATTDSDEIVALSKEHADLKPVADKAKLLLDLRTELKDAEAMMDGPDKEMAELVFPIWQWTAPTRST